MSPRRPRDIDTTAETAVVHLDNPQREAMTQLNDTQAPFESADRVAPEPTSRTGATNSAWIRHYAAQALAAWAALSNETRNLPRNPEPGSRPDIGYLAMAAVASTTAAVALARPDIAAGLIWDLTPEAGALNGEWEDWLTEVLVEHGINPGDIHPGLDPADFASRVASDQPYVCPECGDTAYLHFPGCAEVTA